MKETFYHLTNGKTDPGWIFNCPDGSHEFIGEEAELIGILDDLSKEGYEVVRNSDDGYILRTKIEIEEVEEYWDTEDL